MNNANHSYYIHNLDFSTKLLTHFNAQNYWTNTGRIKWRYTKSNKSSMELNAAWRRSILSMRCIFAHTWFAVQSMIIVPRGRMRPDDAPSLRTNWRENVFICHNLFIVKPSFCWRCQLTGCGPSNISCLTERGSEIKRFTEQIGWPGKIR